MPDQPLAKTDQSAVAASSTPAPASPLASAPSDLTASDYTQVVVHAIGDVASAIPVAGPLIGAVKNVGMNIAAAKQTNRIVHVLEEVARRVENAEAALQAQSKSEEFLVLFYRLLYWARDEVSPEKTEAFIRLAMKLLTDKVPYDQTRVALQTLAEMSGHELRLLVLLADRPKGEWIKPRDFVTDKRSQDAIGTTQIEDVHWVLLGLRRKGLISVENYGAVLGNVPEDVFEGFQISQNGSTLVGLIR